MRMLLCLALSLLPLSNVVANEDAATALLAAKVPAAPDGARAVSAPYLMAVGCASSTDCWAVGDNNFGPVAKPMLLRWNGSSWSLVDVQVPPHAWLVDLTCTATNDCWAVGGQLFGNGKGWGPLVARWNGTSWSIVASPLPAFTQSALNSVTCTSAADCWAVGTRDRTRPVR